MRSVHPAFSFQARARVRTAPRSRHVEIEAGELARVVAALDLSELNGLSHAQRLAACSFALGRVLRCPVVVRAGLCDAKGVRSPGNSGAQLLSALSGRRRPYTAETGRRAIQAGHELGILARAPRVQGGAWTDQKGKGWKSRFLRGLVYLPASTWQTLYHEGAFPRLAAQLGRAAPRAWCAAARLRRKEGGLWAAIRPPPRKPDRQETEVPFRTILAALKDGQPWRSIVQKHPGLSYARIRLVFKVWMQKCGILTAKRSQSSRRNGPRLDAAAASEGAKGPEIPERTHPAPEGGTKAAVRGGDSLATPGEGSFASRMMAELGSDHALILGLRS